MEKDSAIDKKYFNMSDASACGAKETEQGIENSNEIRITEKLDKVSAEFGVDREKIIKCLEEKNLKDFFDRIFVENKELAEDADFWIAAEFLFDYYKNKLKPDFGDREFIIYKASAEENQARFAVSKNLAQKMKITGVSSDNCIYARESQYEEGSLRNIFKEWTKEAYDLSFNKELPENIDQKSAEALVVYKIEKEIIKNCQPLPDSWRLLLSEIKQKEFPDSIDLIIKLTGKKNEKLNSIYDKINESMEKVKEKYLGEVDVLYGKYNLAKTINDFEIKCDGGSFHNDKEQYSGIVYDGVRKFGKLRHEFKHEINNNFGTDGVTPEALAIMEEFIGCADFKEYFELSEEKFSHDIRENIDLRLGEKSKKYSPGYRHAFKALLIFRGVELNEKPQNEIELDAMNFAEIEKIIKIDLEEYLRTKESPAWFKELEKVIDVGSVLYAYSPGDKKYIIDHAIDYIVKKKHNK